MYGFIYRWYDARCDRFYIGCHWGTFDDGYVCSSGEMLRNYKSRPETFQREILVVKNLRDEIYAEEQRWLNAIPTDQLGKQYYNKTKSVIHPFNCSSEERKLRAAKVSLTIKSMWQDGYFKNRKPKPKEATVRQGQTLRKTIEQMTTEQRLRLATKPPSFGETCRRIRTGSRLSEETKRKISVAMKSATRSSDTYQRISAAKKAKNKHWFNDGKSNVLACSCPEGFVAGMVHY